MAEAQERKGKLMLGKAGRAIHCLCQSQWWGIGQHDREQLHNPPETNTRCYVSHKDHCMSELAPTEWGRVRVGIINYKSIAQAYTVLKAKFTKLDNLVERLMAVAHPQQCWAISSEIDEHSRTKWKWDYIIGAVPTILKIVKAKFNQCESFQTQLLWSNIYFVYISKEKFWGGGEDMDILEELDCDLFPGWNWYSRVLTLIGLVAKSVSIVTLMSVVTIGYLHAKDEHEEAKAWWLIPFLAMSNYNTDPESDCDMTDDEQC